MHELLAFMETFVTDNKRELFVKVAEERTRHITVVMEDIYQSHNASAVMRTCDCFGIQDVHVIENKNRYTINPDVVMGATKWLDIHRWNEHAENTVDCIRHLKDKGYHIAATTPHADNFTPESLPLHQPVAVVFGTEITGISPDVRELADSFVRIPMYGFTESFNISVSAAIVLHVLVNRMRTEGLNWQLTHHEKTALRLEWVRRVLNNPELVERDYYNRIAPK
jgi:tRNA (guanosine-2'-O-)-methyltransferase